MKKGLVLEGGAMRGMFTAGVTDVMMENNIAFDGAVGVSAGAVFGCNYKSAQPGRAIRYNMKYSRDPRFCSFSSLIKTGDIYGADFCYREIPEELDIFDTAAYENSGMDFYVVCTDVESGKPVYFNCKKGDKKDIEYMRASASMPLVSKVVEIDGYKLLDGGISDSVPLKFFEEKGYEKIIVVLTQPEGYVKKKNKLVPLMKLFLRKYPKVVEAMADRHNMYNDTVKYIKEKENAGEILVIRPEEDLNIKRMEHDPEELKRVYDMGRKTAEGYIERIKSFLGEE